MPATTFAPSAVEEDKMVTPYATIWREGAFMRAKFADQLDLTLEIAKSIVEARIYYSKGKSYPLLVDVRGLRSTTRDARLYMATIGTTLTEAAALITGSSLNRYIVNVFITIDKPSVPAKMFTNEARAKEWLQGFIS